MSGKLPLVNPDDLDLEQTKLYERIFENQVPWAYKSGFKVIEADGRFLGPLNALLFNPGLGTAQIELFQAEKKNSSLSDRIHELLFSQLDRLIEPFLQSNTNCICQVKSN